MNAELRDLERLLEGGNYTVFLRTYPVSHAADATTRDIVATALGDTAVIGNTVPESADGVVTEIRSCLEHAGDDGYGPFASCLASPEFKALCKSVLSQVSQLCWSSQEVTLFWLTEGHPAYPVFWDFAYLFRGSERSTIFIGSSSD
jgi:hypothetical protein